MNTMLLACCLIVPVAWAAPADAITFPTKADMDSHLAGDLLSGVGALAYVTPTGFRGSCTASLVSPNVVLTAAHCLNQDPRYKFVLPSVGDAIATGVADIYDLQSSVVLAQSDGSGQNSDVALITLAKAATGHEYYDLYTRNDEVGKTILMVGAGISGNMGDNIRYNPDGKTYVGDLRLRWGLNSYDGDGRIFYKGTDFLVMDNDDGTAEHDTFGRLAGIHHTGVTVDGEILDNGLLFGDSGGPDFIDGMIAGVHSIAGSASFAFHPDFSFHCGEPGDVDPVPPGKFGCNDASYGDIAASQRVSFYAAAINSYVLSAVPEPSAWMLMLAGFGTLGLALRRDPRQGLAPGGLAPAA